MKTPQSKSHRLSIEAVQANIYKTGEDLIEFIDQTLKNHNSQYQQQDQQIDKNTEDQPIIQEPIIQEKMILVITSKIVSLSENRIVKRDQNEKQELIRSEADHYLGVINHGCHLTVKHSSLLSAAGIDESNSETGDYILLPEAPYESAEKIYKALQKKWNLKEFGLLITDSHTTPFRRGVIGISLAHWGFSAVIDQRGEKDLFGRSMKMTTVNTADALASAAVWCMGETDHSRPLAVITGADVVFTSRSEKSELWISAEEDLYWPIFKPHLK